MTTRFGLLTLSLIAFPLSLVPRSARAQDPPEKHEEKGEEKHDYKHAFKQAPPPYSIPFQLRPAVVPNAVRLDTSFAFHDPIVVGSENRRTIASLLTGAVRLTARLGLIARLAMVSTGDATVLSNPALGGQFLIPVSDDVRVALFLGVAAPLGQGGGDAPNLTKAGALGAGVLARAAFDNALFAPNYLTIFPGASIAYVANKITIQAEATFFALLRARGPTTQETRINFTTGLHAGYFIIPELSVGAELRYQRFLKHEVLADKPGVDNLTVGAGVRGHFLVGEKSWLRPGVAYSRGLDPVMTDLHYNIVQVDLLAIF